MESRTDCGLSDFVSDFQPLKSEAISGLITPSTLAVPIRGAKRKRVFIVEELHNILAQAPTRPAPAKPVPPPPALEPAQTKSPPRLLRKGLLASIRLKNKRFSLQEEIHAWVLQHGQEVVESLDTQQLQALDDYLASLIDTIEHGYD